MGKSKGEGQRKSRARENPGQDKGEARAELGKARQGTSKQYQEKDRARHSKGKACAKHVQNIDNGKARAKQGKAQGKGRAGAKQGQRARQGQGKGKARARQGQGKGKARARQGQGQR